MITKVAPNVWKISADSNVYLLEKEKTLIDAGSRDMRFLLEQFLSKVLGLEQIENVIFTHLHYDHIGNFDLFKNAKFYASPAEIEDFIKDPIGTVIQKDVLDMFKVNLHPITKLNLDLKVISSPGHTRGSICILYEDILFTGDVVFKNGVGRTDLPTSAPRQAQKSINNLLNYNYKIMCPGHDY